MLTIKMLNINLLPFLILVLILNKCWSALKWMVKIKSFEKLSFKDVTFIVTQQISTISCCVKNSKE